MVAASDRPVARRTLLTVLAYLAALALVAPVTFVLVLLLAGPHAGRLPAWLEAVVLVAGWVVVAVLPVYLARIVWRRRGAS